MAPFGRHLLKAHLKSRSESKEAAPAIEIPVWVCQEEKIVCGIAKRTTCVDVVQALLDDSKSAPEKESLLQGEPRQYGLLERWKGFERALPPHTRMLRLWEAWGEERPLVQFVLVKVSEFVPQQGGRDSQRSGALAKPERWGRGRVQKAWSAERQKRMVRKAFRKLETIKKERRPREEIEIDRMVQLIGSQDHIIQQQIRRTRELDKEIGSMEQPFGLAWHNAPHLSSGVSSGSQPAKGQLQEYIHTSDRIARLETEVQRHRELTQQLSCEIDAELQKWLTDTTEPQGAAARTCFDPKGPRDAADLEKLQRELESSVHCGLSLHARMVELEKELKQSDVMLHLMNQECERLVLLLSSLNVLDSTEQVRCPGFESQTGKLRRAPVDLTDTGSDTGISSTHSQDSLSPSGLDMAVHPFIVK